ncbi:hypothetical protein [Herbaspirillum autotrophicum]|uniref:hypothetical protein n=1 Tax=Herbaspirillum autotrophicum TaxID=180195 RepID=UPI0012EE6D45|nr:hypothetical protein [Herbaspirillum autotrophicum]
MKDSVRVLVTRSVGYNKKIAWYLKEIESRPPHEVSLGMTIFNGKVVGTWDQYIYYLFKGFDNEDIVVQSIPALHGPGIFRAFRKINSSIEIRFSFT